MEKKQKGKTIDEVKLQIQEDMMLYLDGLDEYLGNKRNDVLNECLNIVVRNFKELKVKKIRVVIERDYSSNTSWDLYVDNLKYLLEGLDVKIENTNPRNTNILKDQNNYKKRSEYKGYLKANPKGYSQGEWDEYTIYFDYTKDDEEFARIEDIIEELERLYTHKNDYQVKIVEYNNEGYSKVVGVEHISITQIEFPEEEDLIKELDEMGCEYDEIQFNLM
jgi:hypothetical protein